METETTALSVRNYTEESELLADAARGNIHAQRMMLCLMLHPPEDSTWFLDERIFAAEIIARLLVSHGNVDDRLTAVNVFATKAEILRQRGDVPRADVLQAEALFHLNELADGGSDKASEYLLALSGTCTPEAVAGAAEWARPSTIAAEAIAKNLPPPELQPSPDEPGGSALWRDILAGAESYRPSLRQRIAWGLSGAIYGLCDALYSGLNSLAGWVSSWGDE